MGKFLPKFKVTRSASNNEVDLLYTIIVMLTEQQCWELASAEEMCAHAVVGNWGVKM
jgi:hypothetical protein